MSSLKIGTFLIPFISFAIRPTIYLNSQHQMNTQAIMPPDGADKIVTSIMVCSSFDGI